MPVLRNIGMLARCPAEGGQAEIGAIHGAAVAWADGRFVWAGEERSLPSDYADWDVIDAGGRLVVPGLIDCHTHLCFGGWRGDEFELRCRGADYLEIAEAGGGIASTVEATRATPHGALVERCHRFLAEIRRLGVTTVECKSGYGLSTEAEIKQLEVYRTLAGQQPVRLVPTFLGAHIIPPEYRDDRESYVRLLAEETIPEVARRGLAHFCDIFVERTAYTPDEARIVLEAAEQHGLGIKIHADQLSDSGSGVLAAELGAVSAEHLEYLNEEGMARMAEAGVVAVSLPLASLWLRERYIDARALIDHGVPLAVATDFNPGTAPSFHIHLALSNACINQRMTPAESLKGATIHAARAVGLDERVGSIEPGKVADLAIIDAPSANQWLYHFRPNACVATIAAGQAIWQDPDRPLSGMRYVISSTDNPL